MKRPVLAFSSDEHLPALWIFVQIPTAALVAIDDQPTLIRYRQPDQPFLTFPAAATQACAHGPVSFARHDSLTLAAAPARPSPPSRQPQLPLRSGPLRLLGRASQPRTAAQNCAKPLLSLC